MSADSESAAAPGSPAATDEALSLDGDRQVPQVETKVVGDDSCFFATLPEKDWVLLKKDAVVRPGPRIVCPATFRGRMKSTAGLEMMLVGPTEISWQSGQADYPVSLALSHGRLLITATEPGAPLAVELDDRAIALRLGQPQDAVAIERQYFRAPGFDPLIPENRISNTFVVVTQGTAVITVDDVTRTLDANQRLSLRGDRDAEVSDVESRPTWLEEQDDLADSIDRLARESLLELIDVEQPVVMSLREATSFRRSEVAALAGQVLLSLGVGDVYFGGDGLLSDESQRNFWEDHFNVLVTTVDRGVEEAQRLRSSIDAMESADADTLFRLLVGFSQKQLAGGADEELVDLLDSNSMPVRVLARENLRAITGISLAFKPEEVNPFRRAPDIKKWRARLGKGDIRWQAAPDR
jgi:hypothetical protein